MGSRIREDVKNLFECFCEIDCPKSKEEPARILRKFPESYDSDKLIEVQKFVFPCDFDSSFVQHFSFVLTSTDSKWMFGFCKHNPKCNKSYVVLSYLPWHEQFYKFLNFVSDLVRNEYSNELWSFLSTVYKSRIPNPGTSLCIPLNGGNLSYSCQAPPLFQLPSIPENRNLTEYYNAVDPHNMMIIFASMLFERRVIFTSKKLYRLSACVQAANALIYPMNWQHIFIPLLPKHLIDYLLAPMPYLIGLPDSLLQTIERNDLGEVVILNTDTNTVETPFNDLENFPPEVVSNLRKHLKNRAVLLGDGVSRAFLRAIVQLIGRFRDAVRFDSNKKIIFNPDAFVHSRPASMQPFLRQMLQLQIFQQFIEERLYMLNAGKGYSDEFEREVNIQGESSSKLKHHYKEFTHLIKRDSSAFIKNVKNRANPAVKSAVNTVKERVGFKLKDPPPIPRTHSRSAPGSPTNSSRPPMPMAFNKRDRRSIPVHDYTKLTSPTDSDDFTLPQFSPLKIDLDLMGELKDVFFKNSMGESSVKLIRSAESIPISGLTAADVNSSDSSFSSSSWNNFDEMFTPSAPKPKKLPNSEETNLIRLNSNSTIQDFDPLLSSEPLTSLDPVQSSSSSRIFDLSNPLNPYFVPKNQDKDNELLREYGINFNNLGIQPSSRKEAIPSCSNVGNPFQNVGNFVNSQSAQSASSVPPTQNYSLKWTKFD